MNMYRTYRGVTARRLAAIWLVLSSALFSTGTFAAPGIELTVGKPKFSNGQNRTYFTDIWVQSEAGKVRMTRHWNGTRWAMNKRWAPLLLVRNDDLSAPGDITKLTNAQIDAMVAGTGLPNYILRDNEVYAGVSYYAETARYEHFQQQNIRVQFDDPKAEQPNITGYLWQNLKGDKIQYGADGHIQWYQSGNMPKVHFAYNEAGEVKTISDSQGQILFTLTYEDIPVNEKSEFDRTEFRLKQITDYTGRKVAYRYVAGVGQVEKVTDVLGHDWLMRYNDGALAGFTDPEGRATSLEIDSEGRLLSHFNSDGVGTKYDYSYDKNKEEYVLRKTDGSGRVMEERYDHTGKRIYSSENGTLTFRQLKANYSDGRLVTGTSGITTNYRRVWVSTGGARLARVGDDKPCVPGVIVDEGQDVLSASGCTPRYIRLYIKEREFIDNYNRIWTVGYDQFYRVSYIKYPDGLIKHNSYVNIPGYGRKMSIERHYNNTETHYKYDEFGQLIELIEAKGSDIERTTKFTYNSLGQLTSETYVGNAGEEDATWQWTYDAFGNVETETDPLGDTTTFSDFDALGNPKTVANARTHSWTYSYDAAGNLLTDRNPFDNGGTYGYDKSGFLISQGHSDSDTQRYTVNASGHALTQTDSLDHKTQLSYDRNNRMTHMRDELGNVTQLSYDGRGRMSSIKDGEGNTTQYKYDASRLTEVKFPTFTQKFSYDSRSRISRVNFYGEGVDQQVSLSRYDSVRRSVYTDEKGQKTTNFYDELERVIRVVHPNETETNYVYDSRDNLLEVIDPEQRRTAYSYDLSNQVVTKAVGQHIGSANTYGFTYDVVGSLTRQVNAKGEVIQYEYDQGNRLTAERHFVTVAAANSYYAQPTAGQPLKSIVYNHNAKGQYTGYSDGNISEVYTYTDLGGLETVTVNFGSFSKTYSYAYTPNNLIDSFTSPEGQVYKYGYNKNNQISSVAVVGHGVVNWGDYEWQRPTHIALPGGGQINLRYDGLQRLIGRTVVNPAEQQLAIADFTLDPQNHITNIETEQGTYTYDYDKRGRLESCQTPQESTTYSYDGVGNRTGETEGQADDAVAIAATYNDNNQLVTYGQTSYVYDANGHAIERIDVLPNQQLRKTQYHYDIRELLVRISEGTQASGLTAEQLATQTPQQIKALAANIATSTLASYSYNTESQRVSKTVGGVTTYYLHSEEGLIAEYNSSGEIIVEYHYTPQDHWMTNPLTQKRDGVVYYYQNDHLGAPQRLLKTNGQVVWHANYDTFGQVTLLTEQVENNLRFPGQYADAETGLHYNWHRYYEPKIGRYIQTDPIGLDGGINTYAYAYSNPIGYFDSTGEVPWLAWYTLDVLICVYKCKQNDHPSRLLEACGQVLGMDPDGAREAACLTKCLLSELKFWKKIKKLKPPKNPKPKDYRKKRKKKIKEQKKNRRKSGGGK